MRAALRSLYLFFYNLVIGILKSFTRVTSFLGKEITEVRRRPGALVSLVLGPFLVMVLFGVGFSGQRKPLDTVVVVAPGSNLPADPSFYKQLAGNNINVVAVTEDAQSARDRLARQEIQLVIVAPSNVEESFRNGEQSVIQVVYNEVNPLMDNYARLVAQQQVHQLNQAIIEYVVTQGKNYAVQATAGQPPIDVPPAVVAAPTKPETQNLAPTSPSMMQFYGPAVLALVLQHMGVTLTAFTLVRERLNGAMDIFRVAPLRALEILVGKYLAYGILNGALAALVTASMVYFLGVPLLGSPLLLASIVALLTFASLGLGLLISSIADSERQAVQLSMLVLLASVFLSGFVLPLDQFNTGVRMVAYALPVTHGIQLMQDDMLRGGTYAVWEIWALAGIGLALFLVDGLTLKRSMDRP